MPLDSEQSPIFIVGNPRSGTTLLRMILCAHPRIYIAHESSFYLWNLGFSRKKSGKEFLQYYARSFSFRWLKVDPRQVWADLPKPLKREQVHIAFSALMRHLAHRHQKVRWGDKTPSHTGNLKKIFEDFPNAHVIHIVRDPRGTAQSLARMPWWSRSIVFNALSLKNEIKQTAPFEDRVHRVRLEDLLDHPAEVMAGVLKYLGEPWDDAVLDHPAHTSDLDDMPPMPWFQSATKPLMPSSSSWQNTMKPVEIRLVEKVAKPYLEKFGYAPAELPMEPSWGSLVVLRFWETLEMMRSIWVFLRMTINARNPDNHGTPKARQLYESLNPGVWDRYDRALMHIEAPTLPENWEAILDESPTDA